MNIKQKLIRVFVFYRLFYQWKHLARKTGQLEYPRPDKQSLVIVPCDPWSVGGSRGDEAMLMGVINQFRRRNKNIQIHIVCSDENGCKYINNLPVSGVRAIPSWNGAYPIERIYKSIIDSKPTDVVVLGADCMDGFYSPDLSLNLLAIYDLCNHTSNINSTLLGFSFNEDPSQLMVRAFRSLSTGANIRLRDAVSLTRYKKIVNRPAELVADAAFMLEPQDGFQLYDKVMLWAEEQRKQGKIIIGLNFHPMLRCYSGADDIKSDAILLSTIIEKILLQNSDVSLILIPHDNRSRLTDNLMLSTIYDYLKNHKFEQRILYFSEVPRASQLKALCGILDALISSRMHLAIAALGMKVPVMAATYQGKFEGLFQHFGLDSTFLLNPQKFLSDDLIEKFNLFKSSLSELRQKIKERLPLVQELSNKNFQNE